jgi:hypothetical protein
MLATIICRVAVNESAEMEVGISRGDFPWRVFYRIPPLILENIHFIMDFPPTKEIYT